MQIFDKRIEAIDTDEYLGGTAYVVYLVPGYSWDELAPTHCFGADNKKEMVKFLKEQVRPCTCEECLNPCFEGSSSRVPVRYSTTPVRPGDF